MILNRGRVNCDPFIKWLFLYYDMSKSSISWMVLWKHCYSKRILPMRCSWYMVTEYLCTQTYDVTPTCNNIKFKHYFLFLVLWMSWHIYIRLKATVEQNSNRRRRNNLYNILWFIYTTHILTVWYEVEKW